MNIFLERHNNLLYSVLLHFGFNILYVFLDADIGFFVILTVLYLVITPIAVLVRNKTAKRLLAVLFLTSTAVSYTHLDVYKRQRLFKGLYPFLFSGIAAVIPLCSVPETVDYFQSHAVCGVEEKDGQRRFICRRKRCV